MEDPQEVVAFLIQDDVLYLELPDDSGTMHFQRVEEQVHEK